MIELAALLSERGIIVTFHDEDPEEEPDAT
jgi:hypothetical protein